MLILWWFFEELRNSRGIHCHSINPYSRMIVHMEACFFFLGKILCKILIWNLYLKKHIKTANYIQIIYTIMYKCFCTGSTTMPSRAPQFFVSALCKRKRNAICNNLVTQSAAGIAMGSSRLFSISSTDVSFFGYFNLGFFFPLFFLVWVQNFFTWYTLKINLLDPQSQMHQAIV